MNELTPEIGEVGNVVVTNGAHVLVGRYRGIVVGQHPSQTKYSLVLFFDPPKEMQDYCAGHLDQQGTLWACQRPEWQKDEARTDLEAAAQAAVTLGGLDALKNVLGRANNG